MAVLDGTRLGELFRQRADISSDLHRTERAANRLTLDHNSAIREAGQAATDGGRQRAEARAKKKGEEAERARARPKNSAGDSTGRRSR